MAVVNEPTNLADLVKYEQRSFDYSRNQEVVASGQNLGIGTVVGRQTANGKIYALNPGATDGTQVAIGVLVEDVNAVTGDKPGVILARHAVVADKYVVWPGGITGPQKATAISQLETRGILIRTAA
jgi:hypothetical protein